MRILIKIILTIVCLIIGLVLQAFLSESGSGNAGFIRLIPGAVMIFGIIGVWRYKPKKNSTTRDLDKTS